VGGCVYLTYHKHDVTVVSMITVLSNKGSGVQIAICLPLSIEVLYVKPERVACECCRFI